MQITGHRTDAMFRRYAIVDEEQKAEALARAARHLALRARLARLVRHHQLDPTLVMLYAADCCGRQLHQAFVDQLEQLATENREALLFRLSSYSRRPLSLAGDADGGGVSVLCPSSVRELGGKAGEQGQPAREAV